MKTSNAIDLFLNFHAITVAEETSSWYRRYLKPLRDELGEYPIAKITFLNVQDLFKKLSERGYSKYTLANYLRVWKRFFRYAVEENLTKNNPMKKFPRLRIPPKTPAAISQSDINRLLEASKQSKNPQRDYALIRFLVDTGARVGGIAGLQIEDIDLNKRRAVVREKGRGGKKERLVFFSTETAQAIREWVKSRSATDDKRVFLLKETGISQVLKRLALKEGIDRWNPHSFRHAFARRMLEKGMSIGIVSHLMGHSSVQVTIDFYGRFSNDELQSIYDEYSKK
ncbi:MAG: tyrosine-type recombinase/integrase [Chloroflexota bacterium]